MPLDGKEMAALATQIQPTVKEVDYLLWQPAQSLGHASRALDPQAPSQAKVPAKILS